MYRGARGSSPRLRSGKGLPHRNHRAPLSGSRTAGCGWGGMRSWGKVSAFKEGGRPPPGTSPSSESFPSGATECARGWRGGLKGVGWGWAESQPDPWGECGGRERQTARSGLEAALPALNQGCHESLTLHTSHPQPAAYRPHHSPPFKSQVGQNSPKSGAELDQGRPDTPGPWPRIGGEGLRRGVAGSAS